MTKRVTKLAPLAHPHTLDADDTAVHTVAFGADATLAAAGEDGTVRLWLSKPARGSSSAGWRNTTPGPPGALPTVTIGRTGRGSGDALQHADPAADLRRHRATPGVVAQTATIIDTADVDDAGSACWA